LERYARLGAGYKLIIQRIIIELGAHEYLRMQKEIENVPDEHEASLNLQIVACRSMIRFSITISAHCFLPFQLLLLSNCNCVAAASAKWLWHSVCELHAKLICMSKAAEQQPQQQNR